MRSGWRYALMVRPAVHNSGGTTVRVGDYSLEAPTPRPAPVLSMDEFRSVVFIIRCARAIAFLQRIAPSKYLPPPEERVPSSLLKRLIRELKTLIPKWKWISAERALPRSPARLGDEFFYAIAALRMSRLELWRAGYKDCVSVL